MKKYESLMKKIETQWVAREQGREQSEIEEYEYSTPYITPFLTVFGGCFWRLFLDGCIWRLFLEAVFSLFGGCFWRLFLDGCFWMAVFGGTYRTSNARRPRFPRAHATRRRILCATHRALWCTNRLCPRRTVQWCTCEKSSVKSSVSSDPHPRHCSSKHKHHIKIINMLGSSQTGKGSLSFHSSGGKVWNNEHHHHV